MNIKHIVEVEFNDGAVENVDPSRKGTWDTVEGLKNNPEVAVIWVFEVTEECIDYWRAEDNGN